MWTELWYSNEFTANVQMSCEKAQCGIMHEDTKEVEFDNLPKYWCKEKKKSWTAKLDCKHTFHPSALALHFMTRGMQCPLCRVGDVSKMLCKSLPKTYQNQFEMQASRIIQESDTENAAEALSTSFSQDHVLSMLVLQVNVHMVYPNDNTQTVVMQSPLITASSREQWTRFEVHRSFKRYLFSIINNLNRYNCIPQINFVISHPVLSEAIESQSQQLPLNGLISLQCPELTGELQIANLHTDYNESEFFVEINVSVLHDLCMNSIFSSVHQGVSMAMDIFQIQFEH